MTSDPKPKSRAAYHQRWRALNKAKVRGYEKTNRERHPEVFKAKEARRALRRKPKLKIYRRMYRLKNLKECRRKNREWQQRQRLHRREYMKHYYAKNGDRIRLRSNSWYHNNPGKHSVHTVKRRRLEAQCPTEEIGVINAWMKEVRSKEFARCYWCGTKVPGSKIHFDHVAPLSKGGRHSIGNLCASCPDCNMEKHARLVADWVVGGQYFLNV